jgi:hypothetical protein
MEGEDGLGEFDLYVRCKVRTERPWAVKDLETLLQLCLVECIDAPDHFGVCNACR